MFFRRKLDEFTIRPTPLINSTIRIQAWAFNKNIVYSSLHDYKKKSIYCEKGHKLQNKNLARFVYW